MVRQHLKQTSPPPEQSLDRPYTTTDRFLQLDSNNNNNYSPNTINISSQDPRGSFIATSSSVEQQESTSRSHKIHNPFGHSRIRSHSTSYNQQPSKRLFQPIHHNGSSNQQRYQQQQSQQSYDRITSPNPHQQKQQMYQLPAERPPSAPTIQNPVSMVPSPNWTPLVTPVTDTFSTDTYKQQKQDRDEFNLVNQSTTTRPGISNPIPQHPFNESSNIKSTSLSPANRHSIAISPTPEKQQQHDTLPDSTETKVSSSTSLDSKKLSRKRSKKTCNKCGLEITGQFVRALHCAYHVECFTCNECGKQCAAKFFPYEVKDSQGTTVQVALCEYDYFKKLDLICFNCNCALRGPYITALGNKYHLEHFKCTVCKRVFDSDESYYEHESNIYCHYHYSKLYASHCEGCHSSIVKQFVELYRGGRNQQWHPECYMVHKFWNVCITSDSVGLQQLYGLSEESLLNMKSLQKSSLSMSGNEEDVAGSILLLHIEQQIEQVVMHCWLTLSGYEETTATCISDMLVNACTGNKFIGLLVTEKLILNVEVLFRALDSVFEMCNSANITEKFPQHTHDDSESSLTSPIESYFQPLKKEPRNITGKIMSYLAILRKSDHIAKSGRLSAELLSVITGCAHYLKLLIGIGLNNALRLNKLYGTTTAIDKFLQITSEFEAFNIVENSEKNIRFINSKVTVPVNSTDACKLCGKSIEKSCFKNGNHRWHIKCFTCSVCEQPIDDAEECKFDEEKLICGNCNEGGEVGGFEVISDLSQLIYLLKIALFRSRTVMKIDFSKPPPQESPQQQQPVRRKLSIREIPEYSPDSYSQTLDDVTRLRTKRQSQKLSSSIKKNARKSVILEAPEGDKASQDEVRNDEHIAEELADLSFESPQTAQPKRINSQSSSLSFDRQTSEKVMIKKKSLKIRDEPQRQLTNTQLDRTSDMLKNEKSLTLDDIPRIVAAEQARDQRPNAFKHHNTLYQRQTVRMKSATSPNSMTPQGALDSILNSQTSSSDQQQRSKKRVKYYSELTKSEHFILRHLAIEALSRISSSYTREDLLPLIQTKKSSNFWDKFKFSSNDKDKSINVFGTELLELTKKYGVDSDLGVGPNKLRVPIVIDDVINALRQKDMSVEGIFRLNGNIKKLRELTEEINKNPSKSPDFSIQTAVQLAALMKKWLRELPTPLLTFNLYEVWISSHRENNPVIRKRILSLIYCMMPRSHRNLVEVLLYFFSWVASFSEIDEETGSKMDTHNLATVIAPNILISKSSANNNDTVQGDNYFLAIEVVNQLIELHEELSIIPQDLLEFYESCGLGKQDKEMSSKEIMSLVDKQIKENPGSFDVDLRDGISNSVVKSNTVARSEVNGEIDSFKQIIEQRLQAQLVTVEDMSGGCGQAFAVIIVSPLFQGKNKLMRHRLVNNSLKEEIAGIHAFTQKGFTPDEWLAQGGKI
ncbi:Rho-GTPase-activating protein LRG1 [Spathaspora sp. JA1]|nr:Rho-GTPase-activating protein LRG1 [Spathaspora sp. JA1]